jgi:hypothetical protein
MNILLNNYCNLRCSYCFASDVMAGQVQNMSDDDFEWILGFLEKSKVENVRLIGGEPTLHPQFSDFLLEAISRSTIKHVHIFTNGTGNIKPITAIAGLSYLKHVSLLVNCNHPDDTGTTKFEILQDNLKLLAKSQAKLTLGINIYKPDQDYRYLIDLATRIGVKHIRWTIVVPREKPHDSNGVLNYFNQFVPLVTRLVEDCVVAGLEPHPDCNRIPICILGDEALRLLALIAPGNIKPSTCEPTLDVKPDLSVIRCFAMHELTANLRDFANIDEVNKFFDAQVDETYKGKMLFEACEGCSSFQTRGKACSCLSFGRMS